MFKTINQKACNFFGLAQVEVLGKELHQIEKLANGYKFSDLYKTATYNEVTIYFEEQNSISKTYYNTKVIGTNQDILVFVTDVTKQKTTKFELEDSEARLTSLLENTREAILYLDTNGEIKTYNKVANLMARDLLRKELKSVELFEDLLEDEEQIKNFRKNLNRALNDETFAFDVQYKFYNQPCWLNLGYYPIYDKYKSILGLTLSVSNINDKKKAFEQIKFQKDTLLELAWTQSHLVRSPLANILGLLDTVRLEIDENRVSKSCYELLLAIEQEANKLDKIICSLNIQAEKASAQHSQDNRA